MDEWINLLNKCNEELKKAKDDLVTYDDDTQADHQDGQYCGRVNAYGVMIKHCAEMIAKSNISV